jgi:hypothetical protein
MFESLDGYSNEKLLRLGEIAYGDDAAARKWIMEVIRDRVEQEALKKAEENRK